MRHAPSAIAPALGFDPYSGWPGPGLTQCDPRIRSPEPGARSPEAGGQSACYMRSHAPPHHTSPPAPQSASPGAPLRKTSVWECSQESMTAMNHPSEPGVTGLTGLIGLISLTGAGRTPLRRARRHAADGADVAERVDRHGRSSCLRHVGISTNRLMRPRAAYLTRSPPSPPSSATIARTRQLINVR
jgi:hypothetical protein